MNLLGFSSYTNPKKPNNLLGFIESGKDPDKPKSLYPFREHMFGAVGSTSPAYGSNYSNAISAYEPAKMGVMSSGTGLNSTITGYTSGVVSGTDTYDIYSWNMYAYTPLKMDFVFSEDTIIDGFYFMNKNLAVPSFPGIFKIINLSTQEVLVNQGAAGSGYLDSPFLWEINEFSNLLMKKNITYRIEVTKYQDNYIRGLYRKESTLIDNVAILPNGSTVTYTNSFTLVSDSPIIWGFRIPDVYNNPKLNWISNSNFFSVPIPGYQLWTVPKTGVYRFYVAGGQGGNSAAPSSQAWGGFGARITADIPLGINSKVWLCVGQRGKSYLSGFYNQAQGGGGSFVVLADRDNSTSHSSPNTIPLIIAAGGNGAGYNTGSGSTAAGGSHLIGTKDVGFSGVDAGSTWNSSYVEIPAFRAIIYPLGSGTGSFGGGKIGIPANSEGPGGGYSADTSGRTLLDPTYSYVSPLARNVSGISNIQSGHGYIKIKYLY